MYCNHQPPKEFLSFPSTPGGGGGGGCSFYIKPLECFKKMVCRYGGGGCRQVVKPGVLILCWPPIYAMDLLTCP